MYGPFNRASLLLLYFSYAVFYFSALEFTLCLMNHPMHEALTQLVTMTLRAPL